MAGRADLKFDALVLEVLCRSEDFEVAAVCGLQWCRRPFDSRSCTSATPVVGNRQQAWANVMQKPE